MFVCGLGLQYKISIEFCVPCTSFCNSEIFFFEGNILIVNLLPRTFDEYILVQTKFSITGAR